jgi:hypothetical protein
VTISSRTTHKPNSLRARSQRTKHRAQNAPPRGEPWRRTQVNHEYSKFKLSTTKSTFRVQCPRIFTKETQIFQKPMQSPEIDPQRPQTTSFTATLRSQPNHSHTSHHHLYDNFQAPHPPPLTNSIHLLKSNPSALAIPASLSP